MIRLSPYSLPALSAIPWLRHTVTTRNDALPVGGDMSFTTGAACPEGIVANRSDWLATIGRTTDDAIMSGLIHGTAVRAVDRNDAGRGVRTPTTTLVGTDGMTTDEPGLALMMCFADCVPLIAVDIERRVIGLAHAGWRGTLAGMANHLIAAMRATYGSRPETLVAIIGPSIGPRVYEVGSDVVSAFTRVYPDDQLIRTNRDTTRTYLDLWAANVAQFRRTGLADEAIYACGICTFEQGDRFFSHRYAQQRNEVEGRFAVIVSIEE